jgi:hypothetical protein
MELEHRHVFKFLHAKGLKLDEIAMELSDTYGRDAYAPVSIKYWLHQGRLGRADLQTQYVAGDHLLMILTPKSYRFFGNSRSRQCERLLTP